MFPKSICVPSQLISSESRNIAEMARVFLSAYAYGFGGLLRMEKGAPSLWKPSSFYSHLYKLSSSSEENSWDHTFEIRRQNSNTGVIEEWQRMDIRLALLPTSI